MPARCLRALRREPRDREKRLRALLPASVGRLVQRCTDRSVEGSETARKPAVARRLEGPAAMTDLLIVALTAGLYAASLGLVRLFDRM